MLNSRFRHTQCYISKPTTHFLDISPTDALWDGSNMLACNDTYVAVPWSFTGSTAVFRHEDYGKVSPNNPLFLGHTGAVIDVQFNPFHTQKFFTASEDGSIMGWNIPEGGLKEFCVNPEVRLEGHKKKCGILSFNHSADGVLASAALDKTVKIWDVEQSVAKVVVDTFQGHVMGISWNLDGSQMCAITQDKLINILDPHTGKIIVASACHSCFRSFRCIWAKRKNRILSFGCDNSQRRECKIWDPRNMKCPVHTTIITQTGSSVMPCYDEDLSLLCVGSKGECIIRSYELLNDAFIPSHESLLDEPIKGFCMFPKSSLAFNECEIARFYQLTLKRMYTIRMLLPRRNSRKCFLSDIYIPTFSNSPALSSKDFFDGRNSAPLTYNLFSLFDQEEAPEEGSSLREETSSILEKFSSLTNSNTHTPQATHTDPYINYVSPECKAEQKLRETLATLISQQAELKLLRNAVLLKEEEIDQTLEKLKKLV